MRIVGVVAAAIFLTAVSAWAAPSIEVDPPYPTLHQSATVRVTGVEGDPSALSLVVTYRPNSLITREEPAGAFGADGSLSWTPTAPGITQLAVVTGEKGAKPATTKNVATRFDGAPGRGLLVMMVAGIVLFGGAALSIRMVMSEKMTIETDSHKVLADN